MNVSPSCFDPPIWLVPPILLVKTYETVLDADCSVPDGS